MGRYFSSLLYILLLFVGCVAFLAIAGVRVGMFEPLTGFSMIRKTVWAALSLSFLAVLTTFLCRKECDRSNQRFSIVVLCLSLVYSLGWITFYYQKSKLPKINDITTDTKNPPAFINVHFVRDSNDNSLLYNTDWAVIQHQFYPEIKPLDLPLSQKQAYDQALSLVLESGWELVAQYPSAGVIEATARTPVFGFRDDVILRIKPLSDEASRIDMRSSSRVGRGDYGENATRIDVYLNELARRVNQSTRLSYRN